MRPFRRRQLPPSTPFRVTLPTFPKTAQLILKAGWQQRNGRAVYWQNSSEHDLNKLHLCATLPMGYKPSRSFCRGDRAIILLSYESKSIQTTIRVIVIYDFVEL